MLPFHKRSGRSDEVEDLKSEDIDIIAIARPGLRVPTPLPPPRPLPTPMPPPSVRPPSSRPRVMESLTDEVTCLMPAKSLTLPPPPRSSARPGAFADADDSSRTLLRTGPSSAPASYAPAAPSSGRQLGTLPPQTLSPRALPYAGVAIPPAAGMPMGFQHMIPAAPPSVAPVSYGLARGGSDPRLDPPGTVITTRTKLLTGRPTLSWGAALVALGVFAGLVTAVLARGDGDSLVDATASFVDPSHAKAAAAPAVDLHAPTLQPMAPATQPMAPVAPVVAPQVAAMPAAAPMAPAAMPVAAAAPAPESAAVAPMAYAHPAETKPAPEKIEKKDPPKPAAVAAPAAPPARVAAAAPAARPMPMPTPKADKPAPAEKVAAEKPAKHGKDDIASAKEAKALADAQLEASLR